MPKRALAEHRPWLLAAIVAASAYFFLEDARIGGIFIIWLKGLGPAMLAVYALSRHASPDARLIATVMGISSLADMALELWFEIGGGLFFLAHLMAIVLYLRNRRPNPAASQLAAAAALLIATPVFAWLLPHDPGLALYSAGLGAMAATAWSSRFPRYRVGTGAVLFVVSDLLIFARIGGHADQSITGWLVWPLYFAGQFLIATGVIQTLRKAPGEIRP